jgi:superfamily II DNA or RNA helicase
MLRYAERPLVNPHAAGYDGELVEVGLPCLGWQDAHHHSGDGNGDPGNAVNALRWVRLRGDRAVPREVLPEERIAALEAMLGFLRDPRQADAHVRLRAELERPPWDFALSALDAGVDRVRAQAGAAGPEERLAFRLVVGHDTVLDVEPLVQKRGARGHFSRGARVPWYQLPERQNLSEAERQAYQAYDDRFARKSQAWGGALSAAQVFGILRALVDHPGLLIEGAVASDGGPRGEASESLGEDRPFTISATSRAGQEGRPDIRLGRLRLRFVSSADGSLSPLFSLLDQAWSPPDVRPLIREGAYIIHVRRPAHAAPQVYLAEVEADTLAVIEALAVAPRFPPEAHDALARRLEVLQEKVEIEFPSSWTKTITEAPTRLLARLDLLASGALRLSLGVRPLTHGAVYLPGEGPALILEGEGPTRHGVRRDRGAERQAALALCERLGLGATDGGQPANGLPGGLGQPWTWRVTEGDPAFHVVATLEELSAEVTVEWSGDGRIGYRGSVGLGAMRLKVADRKDWFGLEGGATLEGEKPSALGKGSKSRKAKDAAAGPPLVPLADLFAAIREGRRYVAVQGHGFARLEETLREALQKAEESVQTTRQGLALSPAAFIGENPLRALIEDEAQLEASAAFRAFLRRLEAPPPGVDDESLWPSPLRDLLRPYQKAGVRWLLRMAHWGAGVVLADEMGLGKTLQTLAVLAVRAGEGPALVVAPTSVVQNWEDEAARFVPSLRVRAYRGPDRETALAALGPGDVIVTTYAIATLDAEALRRTPFASLVVDEAQAVKNALTERARALRDLDVRWRLGLTGTPLENHLAEIWSIFRVVAPGLFGTWEDFRGRYAIPIEKFRDEGRRHALARRLRPFVLRRTKAEVAPELPPRTELVRKVTLSTQERGLYEQLRLATLKEIADAKATPERDARDLRFVLLAALTRLRQLCCHPRLVYPKSQVGSSKTAHFLELATSLREDGHRMLVFSQFRTFLELVAPRLEQQGLRVLVLDGSTPPATRTARIAAFQRGEGDIFLISLKAGGFGLNLTAADTVIHLDPWWNPAVEDQATARAHRIGQDKPVTTFRLVAADTLEEAVLELHAAKRELAESLLAGAETAASLDVDALIDLMRTRG